MKVLVTGSKGQLGQELQKLAKEHEMTFIFTDVAELDITNENEVSSIFQAEHFDFCINCAAYTAVDTAETERELCDKINIQGAKNLAMASAQTGTTLIQISTDFVFDGSANTPLKEVEQTNPVNYYGASKLKAELVIRELMDNYLIIRTSWLYSSFGNNFVKTMIRLAENRNELNVIVDQVGTPTYARDLGNVIFRMLEGENKYGIYHYSNEGVASWYDFTSAIFEYEHIRTTVNPIPTSSYPTPAKRPHYSVMDKSKIREAFHLKVPHWRESLKKCLSEL